MELELKVCFSFIIARVAGVPQTQPRCDSAAVLQETFNTNNIKVAKRGDVKQQENEDEDKDCY